MEIDGPGFPYCKAIFFDFYRQGVNRCISGSFLYSMGTPFEAITKLTTHQLSLIAH